MAVPGLAAMLERFRAQADPGPFACPWLHHHRGAGGHGVHVVLGFLIHGNEFGTLPAALRLQQALRSGALVPSGPVSLLVGNPEAALADERFLDEDFNRVFTFDRAAASRERQRAEAVRPVLDAADWFLDFHQTQTPSARAFWTFPWRRQFGDVARALRIAGVGLTRADGQAFSPGLRCLDEYVRDRGRIGLTVELGTRGFDDAQAAAAYDGARSLLSLVDRLDAGQRLADIAAEAPPIEWFATRHVVTPWAPSARLRDGYRNWSPIAEGEVLSAAGQPVVRAPCAGCVLFPKYPRPGEAAPPELMRIASRVDDPDTLAA
jgi:succinylglutamate desuccinylase